MQETKQTRRETNQKGFSLTLAIAAITVLATVGSIGWSIYANKKAQASQAQAVSQASATKTPTDGQSQASQANTETPPKADSYVGWKTYCYDAEKACFRYPADWTLNIENNKMKYTVGAEITSPSRSVSGNFVRATSTDSSSLGGLIPSADIDSLYDLSTPNANYKVVATKPSSPVGSGYAVLNTSISAKQTVGRKPSEEKLSRPSFKQGNGYFWLTELGAGENRTVDQSKAWLETDDAKTALLIAKSFSFQE